MDEPSSQEPQDRTDDVTAPAGAADTPSTTEGERLPFRKRHPVFLALVIAAILVPLIGGGAYLWHINSQLGNIETISTDGLEDRPDPAPGKALNILVLGTDKGGKNAKSTVAQDAKLAQWPANVYRSDTLLIAHISADRENVDLVSIPRDTFTTIHDATGAPVEEAKINEAFSRYGPVGAISTVENLTGLRMDHIVMIDWVGFRDISRAVDGVPVHIPESFYDPSQKVMWEAGDQVLEGEMALKYVRTRYGLQNGDFDRIKRQQNFLRALMKKMLDSGVTSNPVRLSKTVGALSRNITVDESFSTDAIRGLALALRGVQTEDVRFLTMPTAGYGTDPTWGSVVLKDEEKNAVLFTALRDDRIDAYLLDNPDAVLPDPDEIK